jgi:DNA-binding response OmpR family regulator
MGHFAGTLLVVDDDPDLRSLYRLWAGEDYEVRAAADGAEALDRVDGDVDVVVLDREMPRKDGVTVARALRRRADAPAVVMVSSVEPTTDLLDIPVDDYLQKPVDRETLLAAVRRAVAVADGADRFQRLLSLDTRLSVVEAHAGPGALDSSEAYQCAVDDLEAELTAREPTRPGTATAAQPRAESTEPALTRPRQ